jgi:hypothetical protein
MGKHRDEGELGDRRQRPHHEKGWHPKRETEEPKGNQPPPKRGQPPKYGEHDGGKRK